MTQLSRREFFAKTSMGAAVAGFALAGGATLRADPLGIPIGSQTYPVRARIAQGEFVAVLKGMYEAGIRQIELCSPGTLRQRDRPIGGRDGSVPELRQDRLHRPRCSESLDDPLGTSHALINLGGSYIELGEYDSALDCYLRALDLCPLEDVRDMQAFVDLGVGLGILRIRTRHDRRKPCWRQ